MAERSCFGFRLTFFGPFQIGDMAGFDVYAKVFATLEQGPVSAFACPTCCSGSWTTGEPTRKLVPGFYLYQRGAGPVLARPGPRLRGTQCTAA